MQITSYLFTKDITWVQDSTAMQREILHSVLYCIVSQKYIVWLKLIFHFSEFCILRFYIVQLLKTLLFYEGWVSLLNLSTMKVRAQPNAFRMVHPVKTKITFYRMFLYILWYLLKFSNIPAADSCWTAVIYSKRFWLGQS